MKVVFRNETVLSHIAIISSKCAKIYKKQTICDLIERIIKANNEKFVFFAEMEANVQTK